MTSRYLAPVPVADDHDVSAFECRSREQTDRLRRDGQAASTDTTRVFVTEADASAVDMRTPADTWPRKVGALPRRWLRDIVALLAPPTTLAVGDRWCMPSRLRPATVTVTSSPEVDDSPTDELRLVLVMKDI